MVISLQNVMPSIPYCPLFIFIFKVGVQMELNDILRGLLKKG